MIDQIDIINQPYSGEYEERIYEHQSPWNSQSWTWVKFTKEDKSEWVGQIRGHPRQVAISTTLKETIILTSDYVYRINNLTGDIIELDEKPPYHNLTVSPNGEIIFADYYQIEKMNSSLADMEIISNPIKMDKIELTEMKNDKIRHTSDEYNNRK